MGHSLLTAVAFLVVEQGFWVTGAAVAEVPGLSIRGPPSLEHRLSTRGSVLSCCGACGILPDQGPNPRRLHWPDNSLPLSHQGRPLPCS